MNITTDAEAAIEFDYVYPGYGATRERGLIPRASSSTPLNLGAIDGPDDDGDALDDFLKFVLKKEGPTERCNCAQQL